MIGFKSKYKKILLFRGLFGKEIGKTAIFLTCVPAANVLALTISKYFDTFNLVLLESSTH